MIIAIYVDGVLAALFILADMMMINCFVACPTGKSSHVAITTSYKCNNEGA